MFLKTVGVVQSARKTVALRFQSVVVQVAPPQTYSVQGAVRPYAEEHARTSSVFKDNRFVVDRRLFQFRDADQMSGRVHHRRQPTADERSLLRCVANF